MNKKIVILIAAIFIIAVGVAWWQNSQTPVPKYTGPVEKIRLITSTSGPDLSGLIWIADAKGYFKE